MATVGEQVHVSSHTEDKVTKAKVTLENYYTNLLAQHQDRENRYVHFILVSRIRQYSTVYANIFAAKIFGGQALKVSFRRAQWDMPLVGKIDFLQMQMPENSVQKNSLPKAG
jgi:hypothetical protein